MSLKSVRYCDECGAAKTIANHWWAVSNTAEAPLFMTSKSADKLLHKDAFRLDYCSYTCVGTVFNRWLDTGSVVKKKPRPIKAVAVAKAIEPELDETEEEYARLLTPSEVEKEAYAAVS